MLLCCGNSQKNFIPRYDPSLYKLYFDQFKDEKLLAQLEVHMEIVVVAFAFILEDFAELFVEYFCVEKYITGYEYEKETAQSYTAAVSSITLNLIGMVALSCLNCKQLIGRKQPLKHYCVSLHL